MKHFLAPYDGVQRLVRRRIIIDENDLLIRPLCRSDGSKIAGRSDKGALLRSSGPLVRLCLASPADVVVREVAAPDNAASVSLPASVTEWLALFRKQLGTLKRIVVRLDVSGMQQASQPL